MWSLVKKARNAKAIFDGIQKCTIISIYSVDIENKRG